MAKIIYRHFHDFDECALDCPENIGYAFEQVFDMPCCLDNDVIQTLEFARNGVDGKGALALRRLLRIAKPAAAANEPLTIIRIEFSESE
jgi:hypothetical protein